MTALLALVALLGGAPPDDAALARVHAARGEAALAAGDAAMAAAAFAQAHDLDPRPAWLLGRARALAGRPETCAAPGEAFAAFFSACNGCVLHPTAVDARRAAMRTCGATVTVTTEPPGAALTVDGAEVLPPLRRWAGPFRLTATWPDGGVRTLSVCPAPGELLPVQVVLDGDARSVAPTDDAIARAAAHADAADLLAASGRPCAAAVELSLAHEAQPEPRFLFRLARIWSDTPGRCVDALRAYYRFVDQCAYCTERETARQARGRLSYRCVGTLDLIVTPPTAEARFEGPAPPHGDHRRLPGRYAVELSAPDHRALDLDVPITAGERRTLRLDLEPLFPVEPPAPALHPAWKWVAWSIGAAGLAIGAAALPDADRDSVPLLTAAWAVGTAGAVAGTALWQVEEVEAAKPRPPPPTVTLR